MMTDNRSMETRRLQLLIELTRLGSMRAVADAAHTTTSTVSQQLAVLAREAGAALLEPDGRRVRLTPAGRRLAEHAVTILGAVEAARADLDPTGDPAGVLRVGGFATGIRRSLLPVAAELARDHPRVRLSVHEHEPAEALGLLADDGIDLALTYDYNLAPAGVPAGVEATPLWTAAWGLGVPRESAPVAGNALAVFDRFREHDWIVNSRNTADDDVLRTVASMAGFEPRIIHRVDSLSLVQELILAGMGVGMLPADQATRPGVELVPLADPDVLLRSSAMTRTGRANWPALALVVQRLAAHAAEWSQPA
jgi:DNA-binding transcriptional LysR family regulator